MSDFPLAWVEAHMPRTRAALARLPDLSGVRLALSNHLDVKMLPLVAGLRARGAALYVSTCNPTTVRGHVVEAMRALGATVEAEEGMGEAAWTAAIDAVAAFRPTHLSEMGADFTAAVAAGRIALPEVRAGLEATGSGISRLGAVEPSWPIFNWDDLPVKEGLHNRHMVGLTTWQAFFARTLLSLHEKSVLVVGYGTVGQGLAFSARAFGGTVSVAEIDPARRLQARYDGWATGTVADLAPAADVIVTATGGRHVLPHTVIERLRDGCFLLNSGHRIDEIDLLPLLALPSDTPVPMVRRVTLPSGSRIHLFADGAMANLTAGAGDSLNAFDVTLAVLAAGIAHVVGAGEGAPAGVHMLPRSAWEGVLVDP